MPAYRHRSKKPEKGRRWLFIGMVFVLAIFALDSVSHGRVRATVRSGASAIYSLGQSLYSGLMESGIFATRHGLAVQNAALREQLATLNASAESALSLKSENDELRALVHLAATKAGVTAAVTSSFSSSPYGTFILDAGRAEGIVVGDIVESGGFALGRITTSDLHTSLVTTFFAPGESNDALIASVPVTLEGRGGGNARGKAPRGSIIKIGDTVVLPDSGGLSVGLVGHVDTGESNAYQDVYVSYPVNLSNLRFVYVIRS
ncbi:rod shape-determining protein MreC [Candidatus Kaiserbacteria bacterium]|nr:rod shape-determining protein MreC [Candidatus Kaiserbacteria bacterium]